MKRMFVVAVLLVLPRTARAQSTWLTTLDIGAGSRIGTTPPPYSTAGSAWDGGLTTGRRMHKNVFLAANIGVMMQEFNMPSLDSSAGGTSTFHTYSFAVGPTIVNKPWYGFLTVVSVQPAAVVSLWGLGSFDNCSTACFSSGTSAPARQTDWRVGASFNAMIAYQLVGKDNDAHERPWALGLNLHSLVAPSHRATGIPVSQWSINLAFVAGEP